jgi:hypothetical protein
MKCENQKCLQCKAAGLAAVIATPFLALAAGRVSYLAFFWFCNVIGLNFSMSPETGFDQIASVFLALLCAVAVLIGGLEFGFKLLQRSCASKEDEAA